jgi:SAM-dependent methyltransferase
MDFQLRQRGRALMDFEVTARRTASQLHKAVETGLAAKGFVAATLPNDMDERHDTLEAALADSKLYGARHLFSEWCALNAGRAAIEAFEEIREEVAPRLDALAAGPSTVRRAPGFVAPDYFSRVWFHRTHGGWDGTDYQGFIHGEIVHPHYVAKVFPGDIFAERRRAADFLGDRRFRRILEIGTSSGYYTRVLAYRFPDAEIWGLDPSPRMLEQAQRYANEHGFTWNLVVGLGEDPPFDDCEFDLVTGYNVHHELPRPVAEKLFGQAYRMLAPGGALLFGDAGRTSAHDRMRAWSLDWTAKWFGEPYWREACAADLRLDAEAAGFVDIGAETLEPIKTYVVWGTKPGSQNGMANEHAG